MKINLEAFRKGVVGLNAASRAHPLRKFTGRGTNYIAFLHSALLESTQDKTALNKPHVRFRCVRKITKSDY